MQTSSGCRYFVHQPGITDITVLYCCNCFFISSDIWHLNESHTSIRLAKEKFVQTFSTQSAVRLLFIQPFGVADAITPEIFTSSFLTFLAGITTYGVSFVPSVFTARHTVSRFFLWPVVRIGTACTRLFDQSW